MKHFSLILIITLLISYACEKDNLKYDDRYVLEGYVELNINGLGLDGDQLDISGKLQEYKKGFEDIYSGYRETGNSIYFSFGRLDAADESKEVLLCFMYNKNTGDVSNIDFEARYHDKLESGNLYVLDINNEDVEEIQVTNVTFDASEKKLRGNYSITVILQEGNVQRTLIVSGIFGGTMKKFSK
jgi:hypothetical protein